MSFSEDTLNKALGAKQTPQTQNNFNSGGGFSDDVLNKVLQQPVKKEIKKTNDLDIGKDDSVIDRFSREPFVAGVLDAPIGAAQAIAHAFGTQEQAKSIDEFVTDRERKIDYALKNDPMEKSYIYNLTGLSPERIGGNILGMPFGVALKGAGLLAKSGSVAGNFLLNLFTSPTSVNKEEKQSYAGEKGKEAMALAAFMGVLNAPGAFKRVKDYALSEANIDRAFNDVEKQGGVENIAKEGEEELLQDLSISEEMKKSPLVRKTLRALRFNESALREANNAEEFINLAKEYGIDPELNDVLEGAIQSQASQARTTMATLDGKKVRDNDKRRLDQIGGAMQQVKTTLADEGPISSSSEVGQSIVGDLQDFLKVEKTKVDDQAKEFYQKAIQGQKIKAKEQSSRKLITGGRLKNDFNKIIKQKTSGAKVLRKFLDEAKESLDIDEVNITDIDDYQVLLRARTNLKKVAYPEGSIQYLGSQGVSEGDAKNAYRLLNSHLKKNKDIVKADKIRQEGYANLEKQRVNKILQLAKKSPEQMTRVSDELFNSSFDINQFNTVTKKLSKETRKQILNDFFDKISKKYTAQTSMKRLFDDTLQSNKFMSLLSGDPNAKKKLKALKDIDKIIKNMQSSRQIMTNSTTANKLTEISPKNMQGFVSKMFRAVSNGNGREISDAMIGGAIGSAPVFHEASLRMTSKDEKAFFDFIVNPKNTKKFVKVLQNLNNYGNISTESQIKQFLLRSGLDKIDGFRRVLYSKPFRNKVYNLIAKEQGRPSDGEL